MSDAEWAKKCLDLLTRVFFRSPFSGAIFRDWISPFGGRMGESRPNGRTYCQVGYNICRGGWVKRYAALGFALSCSRRMGENILIRRMGEIKDAEWANIKLNGRKSAPNGRMIRRMGEAIRLNGRKYLKN